MRRRSKGRAENGIWETGATGLGNGERRAVRSEGGVVVRTTCRRLMMYFVLGTIGHGKGLWTFDDDDVREQRRRDSTQ